MQVFCDFDGTISIKDTTDEILSRFASPAWEIIEQEWKKGEIGSAECMRSQIELVHCTRQQLDDALDSLQIDSTFPEFVRFCAALDAPLTVISDGVDYFIHRILDRFQLGHLPIIANKLNFNADGSYSLSCPHTNPACTSAAGVCKCNKMGAHHGMRIFVGDGRSDFCAAENADLLFAKSTLATYCEQQNIPYNGYHNFLDVQHAIKRALPEIAHHEPAALAYAFA